MDSVDVVNTLIDIILDEVTRNKMAHIVEDANITFGRICNINAIYNIFPDGDSNPNPQNSSQADKYLTNMAVTDPTKERDTVRLLLKRSCLSPGGTRYQPCQYKPAPVQKSTQYPGHVPGGQRELVL